MLKTFRTIFIASLFLFSPIVLAAGGGDWVDHFINGFSSQSSSGATSSYMALETGHDYATFEFHSSGLQWRESPAGPPWANFHEIQLINQEGESFAWERTAGMPKLPFYGVLINAHPEQLHLDLELGGSHSFDKLIPKPAALYPCRCERDKDIEFTFNPQAYSQTQLQESDFYQIEYLGSWKGVPLSRLLIRPMHYVDNQLLLFPELRISLEFLSKRSEALEIGYQNIIQGLLADEDKENTRERYLIVAEQNDWQALGELVELRESQGMEVRMISAEQLSRDGSVEFSQLKQGFRTLYRQWPYDYALIVGDEQSFPTDYVTTTFDRHTPSDLEYFIQGGDEDRLPDVYYARYVAEDESDIERLVEKITDFEQHSVVGDFIGIASNEGYNPSDREYIEQMARPFQGHWGVAAHLFHQDDNQRSRISEINKQVSAGASWMNYIGHGLGPSWSSIGERDYHYEDIYDLEVNDQRPVIVDIACQNGRFSRDGRLGVEFMSASDDFGRPLGASAFYGGSVDITWHPPAIMAVGMNRYLSEQANRVTKRTRPLRLGEVLMAGQFYLLENHSDYFEAMENLSWYHLLGDPTMQLSE